MTKTPSTRADLLDKILKPHLIDKKDKAAANKAIRELGNYHKEIPIAEIFEILKANGIVVLQEDSTSYSGIFCGAVDSCLLELGYAYTKYKGNNNIDTYKKIKNCCLSISWYKMNTCIEIVAYLN